MINHRVDSVKKKRLDKLQAEFDAIDYKVIKAMEYAMPEILEQLYPGEHAKREAMRQEINELRGGEE
jgi:hypothetical protein